MDIEALMNETALANDRSHVDEVRRRLFDPPVFDEPAADDQRRPSSSACVRDGLASAVMVLVTVAAATLGLCARRVR